DALSSLNNIATQNENKQLAKEKKKAEQEKKGLKKQLDDKLISQAQFDKKQQQLDEQQEQKERELKRKQAIREKALNLFNAIISNFAAVNKTMSSVPYPFNIPLAIAQGIAGGLQIKAIANTEVPELGKGDWVRTGDKHSDPSRGIPVKIERDEAVMSAAAMTDKDVVTVTGTTAQITSALNARKGGTNWAGGANVQMPKWRTEASAQLNPSLVRYMATGGLGSGKTEAASTVDMEQTNALLREMVQEQRENKEEIKNMKSRLHAVVSIKEYREKETQYDAAKKASGIAQ
ncbi:MAG TPA: hypothetical protein VEB42_02960, partial [Chitinophagaceae bacterium]|nr:hypothetical protein [Chitinophagaceae bacterium]